MSISRIIVVDHNPPWVRRMLLAMAGQGVDIWGIRPYHRAAHKSIEILHSLGRWSPLAPHFLQRTVLVPGWNRFNNLSSAIMARAVRRAIRKFKPQAVIYTLPQYAGVAERVPDALCAYYAHDVFRFYDWDRQVTADREQRLARRADVVFCVAEALSEDFRAVTSTPVVTLRMATSPSFVDQLKQPPSIPPDLAAIPRPIVGCIGQINSSYDWDLIEETARRLPDVSFVFVGPLLSEPPAVRGKIESVLNGTNVHWLGPKPHEMLPGYLSGFDLCLNPMRVDEHNHRRSPLRLYDYLATDKPVLSTAIREALSHQGLVETFLTADEAAATIRKTLLPTYRVDAAARASYILNNTWEARGRQLLQALESLAQPRSGA